MSEAAMMSKSKNWIFEIAQHVEVRRLGGQRHRGRRQRSLAVKAGSSQACAGQKMGDGFQRSELMSFL